MGFFHFQTAKKIIKKKKTFLITIFYEMFLEKYTEVAEKFGRDTLL